MSGTHHHAATGAGPLDASNFHLLDPVQRSGICGHSEIIEAVMMEALHRGASEFDLIKLEAQLERSDNSRIGGAVGIRAAGLLNGAPRFSIDPELRSWWSRSR